METKLEKLIEEYVNFNKDIKTKKDLIEYLKYQIENCDKHLRYFIEYYLAIRPTCTQNERKFLDEIREFYHADNVGDLI